MTEKASIKEKTKRGKGKANCGKASLFDVSPSKPERVGPELLCLRGRRRRKFSLHRSAKVHFMLQHDRFLSLFLTSVQTNQKGISVNKQTNKNHAEDYKNRILFISIPVGCVILGDNPFILLPHMAKTLIDLCQFLPTIKNFLCHAISIKDSISTWPE